MERARMERARTERARMEGARMCGYRGARRLREPGVGGATAPAAGQLAVLLLGLRGGRDISQDNAVRPARRITVTPEQNQEGSG